MQKVQDSVRLQTVLAMYEQETVRNNGQPSYTRSKTSVRLHIDQMRAKKLQGSERKSGERSSNQESKRKESLR